MPEESHSCFNSFFSPAEFLAATSNLTPSTATGPDKISYPMLKHLPRSGMDFFSHFQSLLNFEFFSFHLEDIFYYSHSRDGKKTLDSPASFQPISLTSGILKLFERIILSRLLFFLESNSILSLPGRFPPWTVYSRSNSLPCSVHFEWV